MTKRRPRTRRPRPRRAAPPPAPEVDATPVSTLADGSDLDAAIVGLLQQDPTLAGLLPDGVWIDEAPPGSRQFGIVSVVVALDEATYPGVRAIEDLIYLVEARELASVTPSTIKAAAARIDALLENASLTVAGYAAVDVYREERIRLSEVDDIDNSIRWDHRGGHYRVMAAPA